MAGWEGVKLQQGPAGLGQGRAAVGQYMAPGIEQQEMAFVGHIAPVEGGVELAGHRVLGHKAAAAAVAVGSIVDKNKSFAVGAGAAAARARIRKLKVGHGR